VETLHVGFAFNVRDRRRDVFLTEFPRLSTLPSIDSRKKCKTSSFDLEVATLRPGGKPSLRDSKKVDANDHLESSSIFVVSRNVSQVELLEFVARRSSNIHIVYSSDAPPLRSL
jgi:hypothetical protein